jgi:hypothetical protein
MHTQQIDKNLSPTDPVALSMVSSIYGDGPQNLQHSEAECCFQVNTCQRYKEQDCKHNLLLRADVSTQ